MNGNVENVIPQKETNVNFTAKNGEGLLTNLKASRPKTVYDLNQK